MNRRIVWAGSAWEDYLYWQKKDKKILAKINSLIKETAREISTPKGTGKAEILKNWPEYRSKRITHEHRLVYKLTETDLLIAKCREHYI